MKSSEIGANYEEHAECLFRVFDFRKETRIQTERKSHLCRVIRLYKKEWNGERTGWLVKVAFQHMLVENEQSFEDLEGMLVGSCLADLEVQILVREGLLRLEALERQCGSEM